MKFEQKCHNCGKWSVHQGTIDDKCEHCGAFLKQEEKDDIALKEEKRKAYELDFKAKWPLHVKPNDNVLVKILKRSAYGVYFVFMSIMSAILWLVFWLAS